jgi:hypothetical protein
MQLMECRKLAIDTGKPRFRLHTEQGPIMPGLALVCEWQGSGLGNVSIAKEDGTEAVLDGHDLANYLLAMHPNYFCELIE